VAPQRLLPAPRAAALWGELGVASCLLPLAAVMRTTSLLQR